MELLLVYDQEFIVLSKILSALLVYELPEVLYLPKHWNQLQSAQSCTGGTVSVHSMPIGGSPLSNTDTDPDADLFNTLTIL